MSNLFQVNAAEGSTLLSSNETGNVKTPNNANVQWGRYEGSVFSKAVVGNGEYLVTAQFYLANASLNPEGLLHGSIFLYDGSIRYSVENSSDMFDTVNLRNNEWVLVTFNFSGDYLLLDGVTYYIAVVSEGLNPYPIYGGISSTGTYYVSVGTAAWSSSTGAPIHYFYTSPEGGNPDPTPGPLPTGGSYDTSDIEALIATLVGYLIPLLLFLLPAIFMWWIGRGNLYLILIGLAIGAGLTYLFLGPGYIWLVILVCIGIAAALFMGNRSGV